MQQFKKPTQKLLELKMFKPKPKPQTEIQKQHTEQMNEEDQEQRTDEEQEESGVICFCGSPGCRIGGFVPDPRPKTSKKKGW